MLTTCLQHQMEYYWPKRFGTFKIYDTTDDPDVDITTDAAGAPDVVGPVPHVHQQAPTPLACGAVDSNDEDNYDCARAQSQANQPEDGWKEELEQYLHDPSHHTTKCMDALDYWSVRQCSSYVLVRPELMFTLP